HLGLNRMERLRRLLVEMKHEERGLLRERQRANDHAYYNAVLGGALAAVAGLAAVLGFIGLLRRHLTFEAKAAASLYEQRERFRTTLTGIGDAVIATDGKGRVTFLNPVAESLTGWTQQESAGVPLAMVFRVINERSRKPVEDPTSRVFREGLIV